MRKQIIPPTQLETASPDADWLNLETLVDVEITSEDAFYPIESALLPGRTSGWRAAGSGQQTIRFLFTHPKRIKRIELYFVETHVERTQEFTLRWSQDISQLPQELIRQQWNFSPEGATSELEEFIVDLPEVSVLELIITPDISGGGTLASLQRLRLA